MVEAKQINKDDTQKFIDSHWDNWYVQGLSDFIRCPNLSPAYDAEFLTNGRIEDAAKLVDDYIKKLDIPNITRSYFQPEGSVPLVVYVVEATGGSNKNLMMYGHLDKQPWMEGWAEGLGPCEPVIRGDYLYGRGGADDGYAPFSCMLALKNAMEQGVPTPRIALVLETEEESGSPNLLKLLDVAKDVIGTPDFCFCMDSGAFNYDQLWLTSSLRGVTIVDVTVEAAKGGYHSGEVGGIVPETFRILRQLLDRLDDSATGEPMKELQVEIPQWAQEEAVRMANLSGDGMFTKYDVNDGVKYVYQEDRPKMYLNNTWTANLSITGADGLPPVATAGNVVRASTSVRLSYRLPPSLDPKVATAAIRKALTTDVPYNAKITVHDGHEGQGWCMTDPPADVKEFIAKAGRDFFDGKDAGTYGMGGSIPFLAELGKMYPTTQILALGLIGPKANAHAPNECINLAYAKRLTCALSHMIAGVGLKN